MTVSAIPLITSETRIKKSRPELDIIIAALVLTVADTDPKNKNINNKLLLIHFSKSRTSLSKKTNEVNFNSKEFEIRTFRL